MLSTPAQFRTFVSDSSPAQPRKRVSKPSDTSKAPVTQQTVLLENFSQRSIPADLQLPPSLTPQVLIENNISEFVDILHESTHTEQQKETTASDWAQQEMKSLTNAPVGGKLPCTSFVQCNMQPTPVKNIPKEGVNSSEQTPVSKNVSLFTRFLTQPSSVKSKKSSVQN